MKNAFTRLLPLVLFVLLPTAQALEPPIIINIQGRIIREDRRAPQIKALSKRHELTLEEAGMVFYLLEVEDASEADAQELRALAQAFRAELTDLMENPMDLEDPAVLEVAEQTDLDEEVARDLLMIRLLNPDKVDPLLAVFFRRAAAILDKPETSSDSSNSQQN